MQYLIFPLTFIKLYKMGELSSELIGTHSFYVEEECENFTASTSPCPKNLKIIWKFHRLIKSKKSLNHTVIFQGSTKPDLIHFKIRRIKTTNNYKQYS